MEVSSPRSLREAIELGEAHGFDAKYLSGGTALVLMYQQGLISPSLLIDLRSLEDVPGLRTIDRIGTEGSPDAIRIGAGVTLAKVANSALIRELLPDLAYAASVVGNVRVRNAATLAGNAAEADHSSDPPAVLMNRGATVRVVGPSGERREGIGEFVRDFFTTTLQDGEILTEIEIPVPEGNVARYDKFRSRSSEDRPCVGVAASMAVDDGHIRSLSVTVGATTARPVHLPEVTSTAIGKRVGPAIAKDVASGYTDLISPISDGRGSSWYRSRVIEVQVRRSLEQLSAAADRS